MPNELYNIEQDPGEQNNVAAEYPEVLSELRSSFDAWWDEVRPLMVNEDASLDVDKPFRDQFFKQKLNDGIPDWKSPEFK